MKYQLITSDLDGTLFRDDKTISQRTKQVLELAAKKGILFVPATGRSFMGIEGLLEQLPCIRYAITGNGARIFDVAARNVIHEQMLSPEKALQLHKFFQNFPVVCACYIGDQGYIAAQDHERLDAYIPDSYLLKDIRRLHEPVEDLAQTIKEKNEGILKFQVYFSDPKLRQKLTERVKAAFPDVTHASTLKNNVEITSPHADKGSALVYLCGLLEIPVEATVAFGDGTNDLSMLTAAGTGVAVRNAMAEVLSAVDAVTVSNNEDGVADYIENNLLCK